MMVEKYISGRGRDFHRIAEHEFPEAAIQRCKILVSIAMRSRQFTDLNVRAGPDDCCSGPRRDLIQINQASNVKRRRERFVGVFFQSMIDVRFRPFPNSVTRKYGDRVGYSGRRTRTTGPAKCCAAEHNSRVKQARTSRSRTNWCLHAALTGSVLAISRSEAH